MNTETIISSTNTSNFFIKPTNMSDDEWFAIDINDPLLMVC